MQYQYRGALRALAGLVVGLALLWPAAGLAAFISFDFDSQPILGEDPAFVPDVAISFGWDATCVATSCQLDVTLRYDDSGGLAAIGQTLSGVVFDAFSGISPIDLLVDRSSSSAIASALVGAGANDALADFGGVPNSLVDVSGHWGFRSGIAVGGLGSNLLGSVGDLFPATDVLGVQDLFAGIISDIEPNPPDGTSFSIVDPNTCAPTTCGNLRGGFQNSQNRAWIRNELVATLVYDGSLGPLTSIGNVSPTFGTEGRGLVPEPTTAGLLGLGLLALALRRRGSERGRS